MSKLSAALRQIRRNAARDESLSDIERFDAELRRAWGKYAIPMAQVEER